MCVCGREEIHLQEDQCKFVRLYSFPCDEDSVTSKILTIFGCDGFIAWFDENTLIVKKISFIAFYTNRLVFPSF